nr:immunoglobulin heavy chain junction region [Mus musculus]
SVQEGAGTGQGTTLTT